MRAPPLRRCSNLRTLGLDGGHVYSAADIKHAFVVKAKSLHPDAGGGAVEYRQLKDAYDTLRSRTHEQAAGTGWIATYRDARTDSHSSGASIRKRAHIYEERYNERGGHSSTHTHTGMWDHRTGESCANASTRSFYRPYTAKYYDPMSTGFTRAEVARAELVMRLHILKRIFWNCLVYGSALYLLLEYWRGRSGVGTKNNNGDEPSCMILQKADTPYQLRQTQSQDLATRTSAQAEPYLRGPNGYLRAREFAAERRISAQPSSALSTAASPIWSTAFSEKPLSHTEPRPSSTSANRTALSLDVSDEDYTEDRED
ncbi:hypothetical protein JKF63_03766 [Porcisia hertigi]|uniref:J domain-containing protein n=1 Tax=Porcisia hertigi TaxID=2761500 RepID=A0A836HCD8_9TRYP|nr:hypothetical protein JKF63_03766 [Porcisia hertigi]